MKAKQLLEDKYQILETFNPTLLRQLKLVSKLSVWVGAIAMACLSLMLLVLMPDLPDQYAAFTQLTLQVQNNLSLMLTLSGLLLIIGASFTTWFICLYSSFRISGPLYCFSRNLEQQSKDHPFAQIRLRKDDSLKAECQLYNDTMSKWSSLYKEIAKYNNAIEQSLARNESADSKNIDKLSNIIGQVKF